MSWNNNALACIYVDALAVENFDEFECPQSFDLHKFISGYILNDGVEELFEERFGIPLRDVLLLCQYLGKLLEVYLSCHSLISLLISTKYWV